MMWFLETGIEGERVEEVRAWDPKRAPYTKFTVQSLSNFGTRKVRQIRHPSLAAEVRI